jgi:putative membrane protein
MTRHALAVLLLSLAATMPARARDLGQQDQDFLTYAAHDNQGEIRLCLLAEKRAQNPAVKAFARLMVDDHVQVESALAAVLEADGASVPDDIGPEAQKTLGSLAPLHGADFDRTFLKAQIEDHGQDIQRYSAVAQQSQDQAIRRFAALGVPVLQQHLALAEAVQATLGNPPPR